MLGIEQLATVECGDIEGSVGIGGDGVDGLLDDVPEKIEFVTELFDGGDR
ncbi:hypothetical protein [Halobellus sp. Atlit-38R]|nr:hypothetical protein [Halobellus sp. Atlit-38R]